MKNEIILFEDQNIKLEVNMKDETVWLSQQQMAVLFDSSRTNIVDHIKNIYKDGELDKNSTCQEFRQVRIEGKRKVVRNIPFYNLDVIISVGYRVNTKKGIIFRKWANKILKDYLIKGYAVNQKRLDYLEKTVKLIDIAGRIDEELKGSDAKEIIKVINSYKDALNLLDDYDHRIVSKPKGTISSNMIKYEDCMNIINKLKFNNEFFD